MPDGIKCNTVFHRQLLRYDLRYGRLDSAPHSWLCQLINQRFYLFLRHPIGFRVRQRFWPWFLHHGEKLGGDSTKLTTKVQRD